MSVRMTHPHLPGRVIKVTAEAATVWSRSGWQPATEQDPAEEPAVAPPAEAETTAAPPRPVAGQRRAPEPTKE